jgi:hypothetical protein
MTITKTQLEVTSKAIEAVDAYCSRFDSPMPPYIFGPIDDEILALRKALGMAPLKGAERRKRAA